MPFPRSVTGPVRWRSRPASAPPIPPRGSPFTSRRTRTSPLPPVKLASRERNEEIV
ncbi:MAG: hypothetical protein MZV64_49850 [Ignavibacteriales bacterium]|nr:hypothetical protein [Ignavibacteriales bacterium]